MKRLKTLFLLLIGIGTSVFAQTAVTVGSQVTNVSNIVSGKAYLLRWDGLTGTPYILDTGGDSYSMANNNSATQAAVYYLISDGNGGYKIENAYTGKYWPTPMANSSHLLQLQTLEHGRLLQVLPPIDLHLLVLVIIPTVVAVN